ncbi:MAG TPA: DNA polymerase III subunit delta [Ktedonobacteraceae bacterium]|jgi:DNA polymerase-3 subunit delta|nr:DNA polymerase III subunit delta [Ktedonobacteraceae bacterium]
MFYLLHGNDEFTCREQLKKLRQQGNFEYNQNTYVGGEVDLKTITATCSTLPFLTDQRLVVVMGLPKKRRGEDAAPSAESEAAMPAAEASVGADSSRPAPIDRPVPEKGGKSKKGKKSAKSSMESRAGFEKGLAEYIPQMPDSTVLIVVVDEELSASNALLKVAQEHGKVLQYTLPKGTAVKTWIENRAKSIGVKITPEAASMLADYTGNQLRMLANELDKLATYVGSKGIIDVEDVRKLSPQVQEARVFDLTDALAERNRKKALDLLHNLLADGEPPLRLISTITSQVRSLLLVKELVGEGLRVSQIVAATGMAPFVAEKAARQIGKFSTQQLEAVYRQLLATDAALKRSRMTPDMALDLLVVNFGNG